jgi:hypothetical protein
MELDDLKSVWQAQGSGSPGAAAGREDTMTALLAKLEGLERDVRRRDLSETIVALGVMALFGWFAMTHDGTLSRAGALLVVAGSAFIIVWSRRAATPVRRPAGFDSDLPLVQFCRRELERVDAQIRLLRGVWWWYVAPITIGVELMVLGTDARGPWTKALISVFVVAVGVTIHLINVYTARHALEPLKAELEARTKELTR